MQQQSRIPTMLGISKNKRKCNAEWQGGRSLNDYCHSSVTSMLEHLGWDTLHRRQTITRLQTLFKILHNEQYSLNIPHNYILQTKHTRQCHPSHFIVPNSATLAYQQTFYLRAIIKEWNHLYYTYRNYWTRELVVYDIGKFPSWLLHTISCDTIPDHSTCAFTLMTLVLLVYWKYNTAWYMTLHMHYLSIKLQYTMTSWILFSLKFILDLYHGIRILYRITIWNFISRYFDIYHISHITKENLNLFTDKVSYYYAIGLSKSM